MTMLHTPNKPIKMSNPVALGKPHPLPKSYVPTGVAVHHKVKDGEQWDTVANFYGIDVKHLIRFNFRTTSHDHVNWYLKLITGCDKTTDDINWAFSDSAQPGIIYIPGSVVDGDDYQVTVKPPLKIDWGASLDYPPGGPHAATVAFEIGHLVVAGLEIAHLAPVLAVVAAPLLAEAAVLMAIGGAHMDAIASLIKDQMMDGYSLGAVLGANSAKPSYVRDNFQKHHPVHNAQYPERSVDFKNAFNLALEAGYQTARQLNGPQAQNLFTQLHASMRDDLPGNMEEWKGWSDRQKRDYYYAAALAFKNAYLR